MAFTPNGSAFGLRRKRFRRSALHGNGDEERRPMAGDTLDHQVATERLSSVLQPTQAGSTVDVHPADAIVLDGHQEL